MFWQLSVVGGATSYCGGADPIGSNPEILRCHPTLFIILGTQPGQGLNPGRLIMRALDPAMVLLGYCTVSTLFTFNIVHETEEIEKIDRNRNVNLITFGF